MTSPSHSCSRCAGKIVPFDTHVMMRLEMLNGKVNHQRYCPRCCLDPALAVLMNDVLGQPVKEIVIKKVWA